MRICFLTGLLSGGGAEKVISVVASELAEMGHDVRIYIFARTENEYKVCPKINIESMCDSLETYNQLGMVSRIKKIRRYLKKNKPDVAVGFLQAGYALYLSSFGMRLKKIASVRFDPKRMDEYLSGLRKKIEAKWFIHADAVVIQCEEQRDYGIQKGWHNITIIGNPISEKAEQSGVHKHNSVCKNIVMAGRIEKQKNYPMAIKAVAMLKKEGIKLNLHIYGVGSLQEMLEKESIELGIREQVFFHGWSKEVVEEYQKNDIYLLTSDFEGLPNALMEAMASGMICVSTECPTGPKDLIKNEVNGFLVPVGDCEQLVSVLKHVFYLNEEERQAIGDSAREYIINTYNRNKIAKQWEIILKKVTEGEK